MLSLFWTMVLPSFGNDRLSCFAISLESIPDFKRSVRAFLIASDIMSCSRQRSHRSQEHAPKYLLWCGDGVTGIQRACFPEWLPPFASGRSRISHRPLRACGISRTMQGRHPWPSFVGDTLFLALLILLLSTTQINKNCSIIRSLSARNCWTISMSHPWMWSF